MNRDLSDDLKQTGAVAAWKQLQKTPDCPESWLKRSAQFAMLQYLRDTFHRRPNTKKPGPDIPVSDEHLDNTTEVAYDDLSYHRAEIYEAISELPEKQRRYVFLRFWCDIPHTHLKQEFGYDPTGLWYPTAKKTLRKKLAHLAGVV